MRALHRLAACLLAAAAAYASPDRSPLRRFVLAAGANDGGGARVKLRYAGTDAAQFSAVMERFGGVAPRDSRLLLEPDRRGLMEALARLRSEVKAANAAGARSELVIYYSGHSDESGLLLGKDRIGYPEFRAAIDSIPARIRVAVVDACASGALTRIKGGSRLPAFSVDQSSNLSGYAFLTSSSGTEAAQESDRIRASYFTHALLSGLRGGADRDQDGRVTLGEAYAFAFQETLARTEGSQAGAQHPGYDMRLTGTGDMVLTDLRGTSAGLVLSASLRGRLFVRNSGGDLVAELQKPAGSKVELGLEPGLYDVNLEQGDSLFHTLVQVDALSHAPVSPSHLKAVARERTRSRGSEAVPGVPPIAPAPVPAGSAETWIPARAALYPALGFPGSGPGPWSHVLSLNLFTGRAREIRGLQFSLVANQATAAMYGMQWGMFNSANGASAGLQLGLAGNGSGSGHAGLQIAAIGNHSGELRGVQVGGVNHARRGTGLQLGGINAAGAHTGAQAGFLNAAESLIGTQAGLMNAAGRQKGIQAGFFNAAGSQQGLQIGILNVADSSKGLQAGLVNYAAEGRGFVLGALNIILNGMHDAEATFDERSMLRTAFMLGGPYNYNYVSFDMKARHPRHLWGASLGTGIHIPLRHAFADADLGLGLLFNDVDWYNRSTVARLRLIGGYAPHRWFKVFAGATTNLEMWAASDYPNLNPDRNGERWGDDIRARFWPGFVLGVRI